MKKTHLYVDGFNLYYSAVRKTPLRWLNPVKLAGLVFPKNEIVCHKFFTAKVISRPSNPNESLRQYFYWRALSTLPHTEIILGDFRTRRVNAPVVNPPPDYIKIYKTEEKGSDVNLASHLLMDGFCKMYECAIVISGDSDLVTPIRMVRDRLGLPIGVLNPQRLSGPLTPPTRKNAGLKEAATFYKNGVTWSQLQTSQFPKELSDQMGTFRCPLDWQ